MTEKNAIYCVGRQAMWVETAQALQEELGWTPRYWVARRERISEAANAFPAAVMHVRSELNRGIPAPEYEHCMVGSLSQAELKSASSHLLMALNLLERIDLGRSYGHQESMRDINRLLIYWLRVLDELKIDICVFSTPPHTAGEYVLYTACEIRNVPCRMVTVTGVEDLSFICDSFDRLPETLKVAYEENRKSGEICLSESVASEMRRISQAEQDYRPDYLADTQERSARNTRIVEKLQDAFDSGNVSRQPFHMGEFPYQVEQKGEWLRQVPVSAPGHKSSDDEELVQAYKVPFHPLSRSILTKRQFAAYRQWAMIEKLQMQDEYRAVCRELDLTKPFLYFALHYQPERTTLPDGGPFGDQFLAIRHILDHLPEGWSVYAKEHPSQFLYRLSGEMGRWSGYYEDFLMDERVSFADQSVSSFTLLDQCHAVGTVTGMVGWEALLRGKPVVCFGNAWYGACRGAYRIGEHADASAAFDEISSNREFDSLEAFYYAAAIEKVGGKIDISRSRESVHDENVVAERTKIFLIFERHQNRS